MRDINSDILHTHLVMNGRRFPDYNRVYYHSNENLKQLFSYVDVKDKDILSVLASGDQVFHFYNNGARSVDVFDKNKLAIYYYYIRLWNIKYMKEFYPDYSFNIEYIKRLLSMVKIRSEEEKEAFDYWCKYIEVFRDRKECKLFYRGLLEDINKIDDLSIVGKKIDNKFNYYDMDIGDKVIPVSKKYDLLYISNISDYISPRIESFRVYRDNLEKLLKNNGSILSVNLRKLGFMEKDLEREVFEEKFDVLELPEIERYDFKLPAGKVYTRK